MLHNSPFTIIRSDRYRFAITSPAFGEFATAPSNYVSGYVSAKFDEGLPRETNVVSVTVNGIGTTLGEVDENGNRSFATTNAVPLPADGSALTKDGVVNIASDDADYSAHIQAIMGESRLFAAKPPEALPPEARTEFEGVFLDQGMEIHRTRFVRFD